MGPSSSVLRAPRLLRSSSRATEFPCPLCDGWNILDGSPDPGETLCCQACGSLLKVLSADGRRVTVRDDS